MTSSPTAPTLNLESEMTLIEQVAQSLQDHMEQHHGVGLRASEWDEIAKAVGDYIIDRIRERASDPAVVEAGRKQFDERYGYDPLDFDDDKKDAQAIFTAILDKILEG
jgi:hypothetical protein